MNDWFIHQFLRYLVIRPLSRINYCFHFSRFILSLTIFILIEQELLKTLIKIKKNPKF